MEPAALLKASGSARSGPTHNRLASAHWTGRRCLLPNLRDLPSRPPGCMGLQAAAFSGGAWRPWNRRLGRHCGRGPGPATSTAKCTCSSVTRPRNIHRLVNFSQDVLDGVRVSTKLNVRKANGSHVEPAGSVHERLPASDSAARLDICIAQGDVVFYSRFIRVGRIMAHSVRLKTQEVGAFLDCNAA